jgi:hypothetical protein
MLGMMGSIFGTEIIESIYSIGKIGTEPKIVNRTWKERLFSRPWKPWVKTKTIQVDVLGPVMYQVGNKFLVHPSLMPGLRAKFEVDPITKITS